MQITVLGSGSAVPQPGRNPTSQLLTIDGKHFLIDCGEGTQIRAIDFGVRLGKLSGIFISHLHGDHYFGLFGLLNSLSLNGRTNDLMLFGPYSLQFLITEIFRQSKSRLSYRIIFQGITKKNGAVLYSDDKIKVVSFTMNHSVECYGFWFIENASDRKIIKEALPDDLTIGQLKTLKSGQNIVSNEGEIIHRASALTFEVPKKSYAFFSDTRFQPALAELIRQPTLMYHEASFRQNELERAKETLHSTAREAGEMAKLCGTQKLLIGHLSARYKDVEESLVEARAIFPNTFYGEEGAKIVL